MPNEASAGFRMVADLSAASQEAFDEALAVQAATTGSTGLRLAYEVARERFAEDGINRVILCTDGDFALGPANESELVRLVEERARMEGHLRERDKLFTLGLLAGSVAHDLNNPLAVISAHAQLLLRRAADEESAEQLRDIIGAVDRCARIVGDLLNFARRHPAERGPVDAADVIRATLGMRERKLATSGVEVQAELPAELPLVAGDWHQLQQVFLNVIVNAEQALHERGGTLRVAAGETTEPQHAVSVEIWNDGPPIPPDVLPHIFDPLFTTKEGDEGTGLGLFICRRIVREHGGWMDVRSDADGTAFTVRLPVYPEPA
mgnify:CR=1 FL=1